MDFRLISDVHNEFQHPLTQYTLTRMLGDENRVLVIAGDFHTIKGGSRAAESLTTMAKRFKAVVYVPGNHEYYGFRLGDKDATRRYFDKMNPEGLDNIHFLNRDSVVIDGVRFVGATLWTNLDRGHPVVVETIRGKMNDFRYITYFDATYQHYRKFRPVDWLREHRKDLDYIRETVDASKETCVVVTHHAPHTNSLDPKFDWDIYGNFGYASDLSEFILDRPKISYWCHGHIHVRSDYMIGDTIIACNPYGYPDEHDTDFIDNFYYSTY